MVGGREYEIPALPAVDWLEVVMRSDWQLDDIFLELMPGGVELLVSGDLDPLDTDALVMDILEEVSARRWWVTLRLIGILTDVWDVMGPEATFHHVDAEKLSLAAWLDAMLVLLMRRIKDDQTPMFVAQLEMPPVGLEGAVEEMAAELEMSESQFLSMTG